MARVFKKRFPKGTYSGQRADGYPLSDTERSNLDFIKNKVLNHNHDACFGVDGRTGLGKTTKACQAALYLDPTFNLDRVVFTPEQVDKALMNATKGQAVVIDEAITFSARSAMSEWNKRLVKVMAQIRSKSLFIIFVIPFIFDLDRNLVLGRLDVLFHLYAKTFGDRGSYSVYFKDRIKSLYINGKKYYSYAKPKPNFRATFSSCFVLSEIAYENKKQKAIKELLTKREVQGGKFKLQRNELVVYLRKDLKMQYKEIANVCEDLTENAIGKIIRNYDQKETLNELKTEDDV